MDADIVLGVTDPVPESLTIASPATTLAAIGQTAQLTVTANFSVEAGGGTADVTAAITGTNYTVSNLSIASVSVDGLVTAVSSGTVLVSAMNDGALGVIQLQVTLTGADSDGDGIRDGLEIQTSTDPTDPASFDLAAALQSIEVVPATFVLMVNFISPQTSRQLSVVGTMLDGATIDLTSTGKGTNYTSSNLTICNFGATDGEVFPGSIPGNCTISVTNNGFAAQAPGAVVLFFPLTLSVIPIPGFANGVDINGDFAYVAAGEAGLQIVDASDRRDPQIVGSLDTPGNANDVKVVGTTVYVADGSEGLRIIDVSNPLSPATLGVADTTGDASDVVVRGTLAFIADGPGGLQILDVSDPSAPSLVGSLATSGEARGVDVDLTREIAIIVKGVDVVSIADPANPVLLGSTFAGANLADVVLQEDFALLANASGNLDVLDLSDPANPFTSGQVNNSFVAEPQDISVSGNYAVLASEFFPPKLPFISILDVQTAGNPIFRVNLAFEGDPEMDFKGVATDSNYMYLTGVLESSSVLNGVTGDSILLIGQYLARQDTGSIPPTVEITSPLSGTMVTEESRLLVTVQATDDVDVAAVAFVVDGQTVFTDTTFPFQFNVAVPSGVTSMLIGARAIDLGGNIGVAPDVLLDVETDELTTLSGRVLEPAGGVPVAGATVTALGEFSAVTLPDGTFTIGNVSTVAGDLRAFASGDVGGEILTAASARVAPVPGGITDAGDILLGTVNEPQLSYPSPKFVVAESNTLAGMAAGDLNGDNVVDLVVGHEFLNFVSVLFGTGDGTYGPVQTLTVGDEFFSEGRDVALADMNGDGALDLVTANEVLDSPFGATVSNNISVRLGSGDGEFQGESRYPIGNTDRVVGPVIALADLNGDGALDVATVNRNSNDLSVLLGNGDGTLQLEQRVALTGDPRPVSLIAADLNNDAAPDLIATKGLSNPQGDLSILFGNGDGSFQAEQHFDAGGEARSVRAGDFNADGAVDLVTTDVSTKDLAVLLGNGDGTFQPKQVVAPAEFFRVCAVTDVNGDDNLDIVVDRFGFNPEFLVFLGNGDGTFQDQPGFDTGDSGVELAVADTNLDGVLDIITTDGATGGQVNIGNNDGTFVGAQRVLMGAGENPRDSAIADFNADGFADLVTANASGTGSVSIALANPDGTFQPEQKIALSGPMDSVEVADVNGDLALDIVTGPPSAGGTSITLIPGNGDGTFQLPQLVGVTDTLSVLANVNGDSNLDIVTGTSVALGNGDGTFQPATPLPAGSYGEPDAVADLNGDGLADIVTAATSSSDDPALLLGNGDGSFQAPLFLGIDEAIAVGIGQINSDSFLDVATMEGGFSSGEVVVLLGNGDGTFQPEQRFAVGDDPVDLTLTDVDGDGNLDIVTSNNRPDQVSVLLGNGDGTFQPQFGFAASSGPVAVVDMTGDTLPDIVTGRTVVILPRQ